MRLDQQETRQAILFLEQYNINQFEIFTSSVSKLVLFGGHNHINQSDISTLAHY